MNPTDLERLVDTALHELPPPRAPRTLLPAVMLAARAAALRPWYARPWISWPQQWQVLSVVAMLLVVAGASLLAPAIAPSLAPVRDALAVVTGPVADVVAGMESIMTAALIIRRTLAHSIVGLGFAVCVVMLVASVALGAAVGRVALGGAYQS